MEDFSVYWEVHQVISEFQISRLPYFSWVLNFKPEYVDVAGLESFTSLPCWFVLVKIGSKPEKYYQILKAAANPYSAIAAAIEAAIITMEADKKQYLTSDYLPLLKTFVWAAKEIGIDEDCLPDRIFYRL